MARVVVFDEFGSADVLSIVDEPISEPGAAIPLAVTRSPEKAGAAAEVPA